MFDLDVFRMFCFFYFHDNVFIWMDKNINKMTMLYNFNQHSFTSLSLESPICILNNIYKIKTIIIIMGAFLSRNEVSGHDKKVALDRTDILYLPKGSRLYNNARLTNEFQEKCRDKLRKDIKWRLKDNMNLYIDFPCMLPNLCRTFNSKNEEITNRFNSNNSMSIANIENPLDYNQYLPILPVFELIQEILKEMELQYTVTFDRIDYDEIFMMEQNAVLLINIIQKEPKYGLKLAEPQLDNDNYIYTQL